MGNADDEDGPLGPLGAAAGRILEQQGRALQSELWSRDEDTGAEVGFVCVHDLLKGVFYAKLTSRNSNTLDEDAQRVTKAAITTLLDVSEASRSRKISLGLDAAMSGNTELCCSLLYLGFQVVPPRKHPVPGVALVLDLDLGYQGPEWSHSDNYTGTSDCSTADDREGLHPACTSDSDFPAELIVGGLDRSHL